MRYTTLPNTGIRVSKICLGTMTWGEQNTESEAHAQLDFALEQGVNFIDTAELYAIPVNPRTYGKTEAYIGTWLKNQQRDKLVVASKIAGPGKHLTHIRKGPQFTAAQLEQALEDSLNRLQTDYLDLYQLHWPERRTNFFGLRGYKHLDEEPVTDFTAVLETLQGFIQAGKIRHFGISNETPWGLMQYLRLAERYGLPRPVTIQNPYSLVNRIYEVGLAEMGIRENVGLLAYSPIAGGLLSGKYAGGERPEAARYTLWPKYFGRYAHPNMAQSADRYTALAKRYRLSPAQMALAFIHSREFSTACIIGATNLEQLREDIQSIDVVLSDELLKDIETIHEQYPNPAP